MENINDKMNMEQAFCPISFFKKDSQIGEPTARTLTRDFNDMMVLPFNLEMINLKRSVDFPEEIISDTSSIYLEMNIRNVLYSIAAEFLTDLRADIHMNNIQVFCMMAIDYLEKQMVYLFQPTVKDISKYTDIFDIWICHLANILTYNSNFQSIGQSICMKYIDKEAKYSVTNYSFMYNSLSAIMRDLIAAKIPFLYEALVYIINTKDNMDSLWNLDEDREKYIDYLNRNVFSVEDQTEE